MPQVLAALSLVLLTALRPASNHGYWTASPSMLEPVTSHVSVVLSDGRVLVVGGEPEFYALPVDWTQLYNPVTQTWSAGHRMNVGRIGETVTLLADGRVLAAGGLGPKLEHLSAAEIYDPVKDSWTLTPPMPRTRFSQSATLLPDGRVLLVGGIVDGRISSSTLFYDPVTNRWANGPPALHPHAQQSNATLKSGAILIAGGYGGGPEIYHPLSRSWSSAGPAPRRAHPVITALPNGTVLLASGVSPRERDTRSARIFQPATDTWIPTGALHTARNDAVGVLLRDGQVLVAGGEQVTWHVLRSAEIYDPGAGSWTATASMRQARDAATASLLPDGTLLVCGGASIEHVLSSCELYHP